MPVFLRRIWKRHSKLGKRRKKKQVWRKPTGRDNKMREKRKGHPVVVSIGYKKAKSEKKKKRVIRNLHDLKSIGKNEFIIIGKVGRKKRIEIAKKAKEMKVPVQNLNVEKFLKKLNKKDAREDAPGMKEKKNESK